ncbi:MAG: hypothetical protein NVSMB27_35260 [Ktedonobacteraceae bacterium]
MRKRTFAKAAGAKTLADTNSAIPIALTELGDHHNFFVEPQPTNQRGAGPLTSDQEPQRQRLTTEIGYLELPHFGASEQAAKHYVMLAQHAYPFVQQTRQEAVAGSSICEPAMGGICGPGSLRSRRAWVRVEFFWLLVHRNGDE